MVLVLCYVIIKVIGATTRTLCSDGFEVKEQVLGQLHSVEFKVIGDKGQLEE